MTNPNNAASIQVIGGLNKKFKRVLGGAFHEIAAPPVLSIERGPSRTITYFAERLAPGKSIPRRHHEALPWGHTLEIRLRDSPVTNSLSHRIEDKRVRQHHAHRRLLKSCDGLPFSAAGRCDRHTTGKPGDLPQAPVPGHLLQNKSSGHSITRSK